MPEYETISPRSGFWHNVWQVVKTIQARLRFVVILVAIGLVIGYWDTLNSYYDKWTRHAGEEPVASSDVEYFCPMHPYIVRDTSKEKCPICHMDLARRKRDTGPAEPLPPGTVSRVQLTPYRVVLAGVQTTEVKYQPLVKELTTFGSVEFNETTQEHIATRQKGRILKLYVNFTGQMVEHGEKLALLDVRYSPELTVTLEDILKARQNGDREREQMARKRLRIWDISDEHVDDFLRTGKVNTQLTIYSPIHGHVIKKYQREGNFVDEGTPLYDVANLDTVWIQAQVYEADQGLLRQGLRVKATTLGLPDQEFEGRLDFVYPHLDESTRTLMARFLIPNPGHKLRPGMYATVKIQLPPRQIDYLTRSAAEEWARVSAVDQLSRALSPAGGAMMAGSLPSFLLAAGRQAALQQGQVLAVPENAVIDTGNLKIVYREAAPRVYEGVAVRLGQRMTEPGSTLAFYPVLGGLSPEDRVVTNGAFLIDAETRLNPAAGSIYFGGSSGKASASTTVRPSTPESTPAPEKLSADDRRLIEEQTVCAVATANRLGSMGTPFKILIEGLPVFLCCQSCEEEARTQPARTVSRVKELKLRTP